MPNWTKEQEKAIYEPSGKKNILVSAAAGSGKTAVLVERIVNLITNSENPFPIDSILFISSSVALRQASAAISGSNSSRVSYKSFRRTRILSMLSNPRF